MMKLTILGSGTLYPLKDRGGASYLVEADKEMILFDMGPGSLRRLTELKKDHKKIHHIFISHLHNDHTCELPPLIWLLKYLYNIKLTPKQKKSITLNLYGPKGFKKYMKTIVKDVLGFEKKPAWIRSVKELKNSTVKIGKTTIRSAPVKHKGNCLAYRITNNRKSLVYSGDSIICKSLERLCADADVLVLDAATEGFVLHMSATECGTLAAKSKAKTLILSHLYPEAIKADIVKQARKQFKGKIIKAKDLMSIKI